MISVTFINPYDPPSAPINDRKPIVVADSLVVPFRLDWLIIAAFIATLVDSVATWIFFTNGTGVIVDRVLAPLASHSPLWIPIYRLAVPSMIPIMPRVCRQSFAVFFLTLGIVFSVNNLVGHFLGDFVFIDRVGYFPTVAVCFGSGLIAFCIGVFRSGKIAEPLRNTAAWLIIAALVQALWYLVGKVL